MISQTQADFWICFNSLPAEIQQLAHQKYQLWQQDAFNSALHFKPLFDDVWSVRINQSYRALGRRKNALIVWFWIGTHSDYDQLLKRLL
ncbi:MAG TPA: hypothetical protein PKA41_03050 [Verrucomicrobiota bacterium]|nr:hypothetical protein [Verrucomicrobiota bacterium]